MSIICTLR